MKSAPLLTCKREKLQAYYVISQDYLQSGEAKQIYLKEPNGMATQQFDSFLTTNLLVKSTG